MTMMLPSLRALMFSLTLLMSLPLWGQVSGVSGRRLQVKTDLFHLVPLYARGPQIEVEYALLRRLSVGLSYQQQRPTGRALFFNELSDLADTRGTYQQQSYGFHVRYYRNPAFPAPRGQYLIIGWECGRVDFLNETVEEFGQSIGPPQQVISRLEVQSPYREIRFGMGQQFVYFSRLTIDLGLFLTRTKVSLGDFDEYRSMLSYVGGPTLVPLGKRFIETDSGYWGLGLKCAVGILLF
jgi:hypothetical protein